MNWSAQQIDASKIPVMALSVSERELRSVDIRRLAGHMAARNYFQSVKSAENDAFIKMWADFNEQRDKTTNDPMEATFIGFRMWAQAVTQAGTADVNAVRQAMYGQRIKAPSGFEVVMNTNHHLSKPAMIGKLNPDGKLRRGLAVDQSDQGFGLEQIYSRERQTHRRLDLPLGVRRMRRADIQGMVIGKARQAPAGIASCLYQVIGDRLNTPLRQGSGWRDAHAVQLSPALRYGGQPHPYVALCRRNQ